MESSEIVTIICAIISAIGVISVAILPIILNHHYKKQDRLEKENNEELRRQRRADFEEVVRPLNQRIENIERNTKLSQEADVLNLRCDMKNIRDKGVFNGFADGGDKLTMSELYHKYRDLGGNHFSECVDKWVEEVTNLPESKPVKTVKTRKVLNEKK